jgi:hypothetical protein
VDFLRLALDYSRHIVRVVNKDGGERAGNRPRFHFAVLPPPGVFRRFDYYDFLVLGQVVVGHHQQVCGFPAVHRPVPEIQFCHCFTSSSRAKSPWFVFKIILSDYSDLSMMLHVFCCLQGASTCNILNLPKI